MNFDVGAFLEIGVTVPIAVLIPTVIAVIAICHKVSMFLCKNPTRSDIHSHKRDQSFETMSVMEMPCNVLIDYVKNLSIRSGKFMKPKQVRVEAINGENVRCSCSYLNHKNKICKINSEKCIFF